MGLSESQQQIDQRRLMVEQQLRRRGITDQSVLTAMAQVPRQHFIPQQHRSQAYADGPVPIGYHGMAQPAVLS